MGDKRDMERGGTKLGSYDDGHIRRSHQLKPKAEDKAQTTTTPARPLTSRPPLFSTP